MSNPKFRRSVATVPVLAALVALGLAACGSDAPSITGPSLGAPADAGVTVVVDASLDHVEPGGRRVIDFTLPSAGALAVTLRWSDPNNSVTALLTAADCPEAREASVYCSGLRSVEREDREGKEGREGRIGVIDDGSARGSYRLLVDNEGPGTESIHVTGVLTHPGQAPPAPTPYPTSSPYYPR